MKKLIMMVMLAMAAVTIASAQKVVVNPGPRTGHVYVRPYTTFVAGRYYPYYGYYRPYWYNPYYAPFPAYYREYYRPTKLDLQIEDIKNDYADKIWSVRHNDDLSGKEKRKQIHALKQERDDAVTQAKKSYYIKQ